MIVAAMVHRAAACHSAHVHARTSWNLAACDGIPAKTNLPVVGRAAQQLAGALGLFALALSLGLFALAFALCQLSPLPLVQPDLIVPWRLTASAHKG